MGGGIGEEVVPATFATDLPLVDDLVGLLGRSGEGEECGEEESEPGRITHGVSVCDLMQNCRPDEFATGELGAMRETDGRNRALPEFAGELDRAAGFGGDGMGDGEAEACSAGVSIA